MRLDQVLVQKKLVPSRTKAKELIESGSVCVEVNGEWLVVTSPSYSTSLDSSVEIRDLSLLRFVSRAGLKLEGALRDFSVSAEGVRALDVGQSTGGFTDCLLQNGALEVLGFDVGQGQLHEKIKQDPRVLFFENLHVFDFPQHQEISTWIKKGVDLCVIDVSFISVVKVFEVLSSLKGFFSQTQFLTLIKPQFEVGKENLGKDGVIKDPKLVVKTLLQVEENLRSLGFQVLTQSPSCLQGADGNQEHFFHIHFRED